MEITLEVQNFPKQQTIFDSKAKYKIVHKGRRFGLTKGAANDFIICALNGTFKRGLWVDTVNTNIDRYIERYFMPHLKRLPENIWSWKKQDKIVTIQGCYIDFRSADRPENIEGFGYDKFFINEAGIVLKDEYLWNNAIRPMMWDYKKATGVIGGTPKGKGVFYDLAQRGYDKEKTDYETFHFTSFDNPYLNLESLRGEIVDMPERVVQQEVYAEFLDDTGVVFRNVKNVMTSKPEEPKEGHNYVMGVDLAKVQDYTVITVYDRDNNNQVYQDRFKTLEWPFQKKKIAVISNHYNHAVINIDATGLGDPIAEDLARAGIPVEPIKLSNEMKKEIIEKLVIYIEQKKISMLPIQETLQEFSNFTYDISSTGKIRYEAPTGFHDDIVISHALAIWSMNPIFKEIPDKVLNPLQIKFIQAQNKYQEGDEYDQERDWREWEQS